MYVSASVHVGIYEYVCLCVCLYVCVQHGASLARVADTWRQSQRVGLNSQRMLPLLISLSSLHSPDHESLVTEQTGRIQGKEAAETVLR